MSRTDTPDTRPVVQVDIVSDVVCPWCVVGYLQLERALDKAGLEAQIRWHPFELNPQMPPEGERLRDHMARKYGTTAAQSAATRDNLAQIGATLGFTFNLGDDMRMVNTFAAHQLLDWAGTQGRQHPLALHLFKTHFTDNLDVSDPDVLTTAAEAAGLDPQAAAQVLASGERAAGLREKQAFWIERGIQSVPSTGFAGKYLLTGAVGEDGYAQVLQRCRAEAA